MCSKDVSSVGMEKIGLKKTLKTYLCNILFLKQTQKLVVYIIVFIFILDIDTI